MDNIGVKIVEIDRESFENFDMLLCIGNRVDVLYGHQAHDGYMRHLKKLEES